LTTNKKKVIKKKVNELNKVLDTHEISASIETNTLAIKQLFTDNDTIMTRSIVNKFDNSLQFSIVFIDAMVDSLLLSESIIKPLMESNIELAKNNLLDSLINQVILVNNARKVKTMREVIENVTYGDTILFVEGSDRALVLDTKNFETRAIEEPQNEKALSGPKEGFNESLFTNLSLINRKLRTNDLKMKYANLGKISNTKCCVCYLDSIVNKQVLEELYQRLQKIDIDGILDANYIIEMIKDAPKSLFQTIGYTERPDVVVGKLLEGRIAVLIDGTPIVLTLPFLFVENFQSNEDYYLSYYYSTFTRIIRFIGFILTITVPAFYVSMVGYHHEMLPTPLFVNITLERQSVPFPAAVEAFIMLFIFDILKETGVRMPASIGPALSIVGALVIGESAVEAKLIAAPIIIVVALTGITSILIPRMNASLIYMRYFLLLLTSTLGFYGFVLGISFMFIHIINLRSFGIPYVMLAGDTSYQSIKDTFIRAPWKKMRLRPKLVTDNQQRMKVEDQK
jgi:spore germination protein KA